MYRNSDGITHSRMVIFCLIRIFFMEIIKMFLSNVRWVIVLFLLSGCHKMGGRLVPIAAGLISRAKSAKN